MIALAPAEIRARKRPLAVLFVYGAELAWALVVATPAHAWAKRVWGAHPDGDSVLFRASGRELLVWLGQTDAGMAVTTSTTLFLLVLGAVLMQLPLGALLSSLAFSRGDGAEANGGRSLRPVEALRAGIGTFMPLSGALALGAVASTVVVAIGVMASSAVARGFAGPLGDARAFQLRLATLGLFLGLAAIIGVVVDLARAAIAREAGLGAAAGKSAPGWSVMLRGVKVALGASRRDLLRATAAWASRGAVGLALVAVGFVAAASLGGRGGTALVALFVVHQLVVLGRVALRASWLSRALAIVAPVQDAPSRVQAAHDSQAAAPDEPEPPAPETD